MDSAGRRDRDRAWPAASPGRARHVRQTPAARPRPPDTDCLRVTGGPPVRLSLGPTGGMTWDGTGRHEAGGVWGRLPAAWMGLEDSATVTAARFIVLVQPGTGSMSESDTVDA